MSQVHESYIYRRQPGGIGSSEEDQQIIAAWWQASGCSMKRMLKKAMGTAGVLSYVEVAKRAGLDPRTVRGIDEGVKVSTLEKIATALGGTLRIEIVFPTEGGSHGE